MEMLVIAIDGFAGVGKSTVARKTAERLGVLHLNSGFIFRAIALKVLKKNLKTSVAEDVLKILSETTLDLTQVSDNTGTSSLQVVMDGQLLGDELLEESIGKGSSEVAKFLDVRDFACRLQRKMAEKSSIVVEGRDAGTVIFPNARFKFFLTANSKVAAKRRLGQLRQSATGEIEKSPEQLMIELERVEAEIKARDLQDATREVAPTVKADDAVEIDTSELSADEVVERIVQIVNNQLV
jgi:cytidylate kinase